MTTTSALCAWLPPRTHVSAEERNGKVLVAVEGNGDDCESTVCMGLLAALSEGLPCCPDASCAPPLMPRPPTWLCPPSITRSVHALWAPQHVRQLRQTVH